MTLGFLLQRCMLVPRPLQHDRLDQHLSGVPRSKYLHTACQIRQPAVAATVACKNSSCWRPVAETSAKSTTCVCVCKRSTCYHTWKTQSVASCKCEVAQDRHRTIHGSIASCRSTAQTAKAGERRSHWAASSVFTSAAAAAAWIACYQTLYPVMQESGSTPHWLRIAGDHVVRFDARRAFCGALSSTYIYQPRALTQGAAMWTYCAVVRDVVDCVAASAAATCRRNVLNTIRHRIMSTCRDLDLLTFIMISYLVIEHDYRIFFALRVTRRSFHKGFINGCRCGFHRLLFKWQELVQKQQQTTRMYSEWPTTYQQYIQILQW